MYFIIFKKQYYEMLTQLFYCYFEIRKVGILVKLKKQNFQKNSC